MKNFKEILTQIYNEALEKIKNKTADSFIKNFLSPLQISWLETIVKYADTQKAVLSALTTSLLKKIQDPAQDIRLHKIELKGGYSGRTLDTKYTTPFFKENFPRLAMKESGWLTRSIEQPHPFNLKFPGKIKNQKVKNAFLQIINDVEENHANPKYYLLSLFIMLIKQTQNIKKEIRFSVNKDKLGGVTIDLILSCLKEHFFKKYNAPGASKLPVIAIYSIYQLLLKDVERYKNKTLLPLKSHISADLRTKSIGDIEILDENNKYFEAVEIKHGIPINAVMVKDCFNKFKNTPVKRYYLLTTAQPNIKPNEEKRIAEIIQKIKENHGCEVIVNGIMSSLKYYLRLVKDPKKFMEIYSRNLKLSFVESSEIKKSHIKAWQKIIKQKL